MLKTDFGKLYTENANMQKVIDLASQIADSEVGVLITGEKGVGKHTLAQYIHERSSRKNAKLIAVQACDLTIDHFEQANGSTLVIKNIENLKQNMQQNLLSIIESGEIFVSGVLKRLDVRLLTTTEVLIDELTSDGRFSEDLLLKIAVIQLDIPSLASRKEDIIMLAKNYVISSCMLNKRTTKVLTQSALEKLLSWSWPSNVRELESVIDRSVIISNSEEIYPEHIVFKIDSNKSKKNDLLPGMTIWEVEKKLIVQTLQFTEQNRTRAAQLLGISIRTLRNKLNEYQEAGVI